MRSAIFIYGFICIAAFFCWLLNDTGYGALKFWEFLISIVAIPALLAEVLGLLVICSIFEDEKKKSKRIYKSGTK